MKSEKNILDTYELRQPGAQNILDIFEGEWSSKLPEELLLHTRPGTAPLFEDARIEWLDQISGGLKGLSVLELGPLEAGHSYLLQKMGAASILSIEANTRAFLKCLCIKEIFKLDRVNFLLGDFVKYLEQDHRTFDLVMASGVLYHMEDPAYLLKLISNVTQRIFIWTHYYDADIIMGNWNLAGKFEKIKTAQIDDLTYSYSVQSYKKALKWNGFCGGPLPFSRWLTRESILNILNKLGFKNIEIRFEQTNHPNGPAFGLYASKS